MKVTRVSASLSRAAGGIFEIEVAISKQLHDQGVQTNVIGLYDDDWLRDYTRWKPLNARVFPIDGFNKFGYSRQLGKHLVKADYDILHLNTLWMYPSIAVSHTARNRGKPYVVTPNGMLEPWALKNSGIKKNFAGWLYENRNLSRAACLHANTDKELRDMRAYGLKNPVCVIPNGVDLVDAETLKAERLKSEKKILLFLGRLHPKKGLVNALKAWKQALHSTSSIQNSKFDEWQFVVAGWDQGGHEAELKRLCDELGLAYADVSASDFTDNRQRTTDNGSSVLFTGPAFGATKDQLLRRASAFILPSFSEGLPMSVLEAWSYSLPVLMTDECNLPEGFAADAALRIGTDVESIAEGLREFFSLPSTDNGQLTTSLASLGANGRALVERRFTWKKVAADMKQVYEWLVGGGSKPDSIERQGKAFSD